MSNEPTIGQFMTPTPCTADEGLSLLDAQDRMTANNIRHLLVTRDDRLVGVVSTRDISFALALPGVKTDKLTVFSAMTAAPFVCDIDDSLAEVAREMESNRYGCAAVRQDNRVVGIFTTTDALRALRAVIAGEEVSAEVKPTHIVEQPATREKVEHHVRAGQGARGAMPSPNQGKIGGKVV